MQLRASITAVVVSGFAVLQIASAAPPPGTPRLPAPGGPALDPNKAAFPLPDLVIMEITKGPGSRAHVRNQGKGNADSCTLGVNCLMGTTSTGASFQSTALFQVPALKAGGETWVSLGKCMPVKANIDADKTVKESNEGNNSYAAKG